MKLQEKISNLRKEKDLIIAELKKQLLGHSPSTSLTASAIEVPMVVSSASSSDAPSSDAAPLPATSQISMSTTEPSSAADGAGDADVAMSQTTTAADQ